MKKSIIDKLGSVVGIMVGITIILGSLSTLIYFAASIKLTTDTNTVQIKELISGQYAIREIQSVQGIVQDSILQGMGDMQIVQDTLVGRQGRVLQRLVRIEGTIVLINKEPQFNYTTKLWQ